MKLKDFVAETLKELIGGVEEAQDFAAEKGAMINPPMTLAGATQIEGPLYYYQSEDGMYYAQIIDFDVAISISNDTEGEVNGGIGVISGVFNVGAKSKASTKDSNNESSRVRFSIPVMFPLQKKVAPKQKSNNDDPHINIKSKWS